MAQSIASVLKGEVGRVRAVFDAPQATVGMGLPTGDLQEGAQQSHGTPLGSHTHLAQGLHTPKPDRPAPRRRCMRTVSA